MMGMGKLGASQLGWPPFLFVTEIVRGEPRLYPPIVPGFTFRGMGCHEFMGEWPAGIIWFEMLEYTCGPVEVTYRKDKTYKVWVIAPLEFFEEATTELTRWVEERDLDTYDDNSFAICLHEGFTDFHEAVAWWSLADGVLFTLREDVAQELISGLQAALSARKAMWEGTLAGGAAGS